MKYVIDLKHAVIDQTSLSEQLELAVYLLTGIYQYSEMYLDDGDDLQYRRLLLVKNKLEHSISIINSIQSVDLALS